MIRAVACSFLCVVTSLALAACNPCNRSGCDALGRPAADDHTSAIAGVVADESDVVANSCQECPFYSMALSIWTAPGLVTDVAGAKAVIQAGPAAVTLQADGRYRQTLNAGSYLLCALPSSNAWACVGIEVIADHVTPVNLKLLYGPFQFTVFDPLTHNSVTTTALYPSP
jgi:hypothetical protein